MTQWEEFFKEKVTKIFTENKTVLDIGGGLRISKKSGNRHDSKNKWMLPLLSGVAYKILDPVLDYNPDIVGDIHSLPFENNSQDAIVCIAVLEHVENPTKAASEMRRVLKDGGHLLVYVPFIYYYHAESGYYKDYWRFTKDSLALLFDGFSKMEIQAVRWALATWIHLSPLGRFKIIVSVANALDSLFGKDNSNQVSGYYIFLIK